MKEKIKENYNKLITGKYYNIDYNRIPPQEREEVVQKAMREGLVRMFGGIGMAIVLSVLLIWVLFNIKV